jgi:hypothetical protein
MEHSRKDRVFGLKVEPIQNLAQILPKLTASGRLYLAVRPLQQFTKVTESAMMAESPEEA